jgi:hypothetical protein
VDFDCGLTQEADERRCQDRAPSTDCGLYGIERSSSNPRARFLDIIQSYFSISKPGLEPRGKFDHFRRIGPASWPRAFHYEFLDYGDKVGVEIHLESDAVLPLRFLVESLLNEISTKMHPATTNWDPTWWKNRGRLRTIYPDSVPATNVAKGMAMLVEATFAKLDPAASILAVPVQQSLPFSSHSANALLAG